MTIPERFQKIMDTEGLSPAQFADEIGVQRSSLSHILSGRNNPGFDYLTKILKRFDKLDANWLMTGSGDMYRQGKESHSVTHNQLFDIDEQTDKMNGIDMVKSEEQAPYGKPVDSVKPELKDEPVKSTGIQSKKIVKMVEFFSNETFRIYYPAE